MKKIIIFGNSGSGKSTLSKKISNDENIAHLDLDTLAFPHFSLFNFTLLRIKLYKKLSDFLGVLYSKVF